MVERALDKFPFFFPSLFEVLRRVKVQVGKTKVTFVALVFTISGLTAGIFLPFNAGPAKIPGGPPLQNLALVDLNGEAAEVSDRQVASLVYYLGNDLQCKLCVNDLTWWTRYKNIYQNVDFISVYEAREGNVAPLLDLLETTGFDGKSVVDNKGKFRECFNLAGGPAVLAFNSEYKLVTMVRYDDFGLENRERGRFFHRLLSRLNN